jgi:hypothetical protein
MLGRATVIRARDSAVMAAAVRSLRSRMLAGILAGAFAAWVVAALPIPPAGAALALAPGVGAAVAIAVVSSSRFSRRTPSDGVRRAELTPRRADAFRPRWAFILPGATTALLIVALVTTGLSASPVDGPFSHEFLAIVPQGTNSAGPYPDWSYGSYILGATVVLLSVVLFALNRVASTVRVADHDSFPIEELIRRTLTRFIALSGTAVVVLYLGAVSFTAGAAMRAASSWFYIKPSYIVSVCGRKSPCSVTSTPADLVTGVAQPTYSWGSAFAVVGIVLIVIAFVITLLALSNFIIRWTVDAPAQRETVDA